VSRKCLGSVWEVSGLNLALGSGKRQPATGCTTEAGAGAASREAASAEPAPPAPSGAAAQ